MLSHARCHITRPQALTLLAGLACAGALSRLGVVTRAAGAAVLPKLGLAASLGVMRSGAMPFLAPGVVGGWPRPACICATLSCRGAEMLRAWSH